MVCDIRSNNPITLRESPDSGWVGRQVKLTHFFTEAQILNALLENPKVSDSLGRLNSSFKPRSINDLVQFYEKSYEKWMSGDLVENDLDISDFRIDGSLTGELSDHLLYGFTFDRIDGDSVLVKVALRQTGKNHEIPHLDLVLPIPDLIRDDLTTSANREQGFLYNWLNTTERLNSSDKAYPE